MAADQRLMAARISIELDENVLELALGELELLDKRPTFTLNHSGQFLGFNDKFGHVRGMYDAATHHISLATQHEQYEREGFYVMTKHFRFTLLHELRHAHQQTHWTAAQLIEARRGPYEFRIEEIDANQWADYAMPKFVGVVRVQRQRIGKSGFGSLSAHTNRRSA